MVFLTPIYFFISSILDIRTVHISSKYSNSNPGILLFENAQNFDYFKVNASEFDSDLKVGFSKSDRQNQTLLDYTILFGGWGGTGLDFLLIIFTFVRK